MTDLDHSDAQEERSQLDGLDELNIADLRKYCKIMSIPSQRDWTKEDYVRAIKLRQESQALTGFVFDSSQGPKPGHARVLIHRDPTPGHKNSPVHVGYNGALIAVPRGLEIDIPLPFIESLQNAKTVYIEQASDATRENPGGVYTDNERSSYPFQIIAVTPGEYINPNDNRGQKAREKEQFFKEVGSYPTDGELRDWKRIKMEQKLNNK